MQKGFLLATWAPADWHEPSLPAFPSYRTQRIVFVSATGNTQKRHVMSLITSYLTASAATTRSLLRIPCYVKLVTCQNQSQDGVRWSGQPGRRFLRLLLRVAAAGTQHKKESEREPQGCVCVVATGGFSESTAITADVTHSALLWDWQKQQIDLEKWQKIHAISSRCDFDTRCTHCYPNKPSVSLVP